MFHLAAVYSLWHRDAERMWSVNVSGTRNVLESAAREGVDRIVHTSSIACFGGQGPGRRATESSPFRLGETGDVYSRTKHVAQAVAEGFARAGHDVVIAAPTGPLGPGDVGPTPTGRLLVSLLGLPVVTVAPTVSNFADVRDIARGHVAAANLGVRGETYLLGGHDVSLRALAELALGLRGRHRPVVEVPYPLLRVAGRAAALWADAVGRPPLLTPEAVAIAERGLAADCQRAESALGLPHPRPLEETLADALAWFEREGKTG